MKHENLALRRRLAYAESQLETESLLSRRSTRLKEERQHRFTDEKNSTQRSLDSIVYPILTLPVEVTTEIFVHCLPENPILSGKLAPLLLGRICRKWRDIAYGHPRLWAALVVRSWGGASFEFLVRLWLRCARAVPLSLTLKLPYGHCLDSFFTTIGCCTRQCPSSLPFIEHWANLSSFSGTCFTPAECFDLLSRAPRLSHCEFNQIPVGLLATSTSHLLLPKLEHLQLNPHSVDIRPLLLVLDHLALPALRSLKIVGGFRGSDATTFQSFLQRAPKLQMFDGSFDETRGRLALGEVLTEALRAMPLLTSLRLSAEPTSISNIVCLLPQSHIFLPHLEKVALSTLSPVYWTDSLVTSFVDGLTSRWEAKSGLGRLVDFEYLFVRGIFASLDERIIACVSKLRGEGMRIHVSARGPMQY